MAGLIRAADWSSTPLGPVRHWAGSLRVALEMVLATRFPMALYVGPQLHMLYNDAFAAILGGRDPAALGRPAALVWADLWEQVAPGMRRVFETGETQAFDGTRFLIESEPGRIQERYFDGCWSRVEDEAGGAVAVLAVVKETTARVHVEHENQRLLAQARGSAEQLQRMFEQAPGFVALLRGPDHVFELVNRAYYQLVGHRDIVGKPVLEALPEMRGQGFKELLDRVFATAKPFVGRALPFEVQRRVDAPVSRAFVDLVYQPVLAADGSVSGIFVQGHDVTEQQRALTALHESEERFRLAVESSSLGTYEIDPRADAITLSPSVARLYGLVADRALPLDEVFDRIHLEDRGPMRALLARALTPDGHEEYTYQHRVVRPDGTLCWLDARARVRFATDQAGESHAIQVIGVVWDITEQQQSMQALRDSEARFRLLADTMPQIVWATRPDGYHDYFNERWYEYTGMPRPDEPGGEYDPHATGQGWNWKDYLHPDDYQRTLDLWSACLATGEPYHVEYRFKRRDGQYRWFIGRALALRDEAGRIVRWFGTLTDLHDQKLTAQERDALIEQLRSTDQRKDEFLATLAHELRNPLAPLRNVASLLKRSGPSAAQAPLLEIMERQVGQLRRLVEDLLEVSRITQGKITLKRAPMSVGGAVYAALEAIQPLIEQRRQVLEARVNSSATVDLDIARITQVITNLLNNAAKFSAEGGRITLDAFDDADEVLVRVRDEGVGIAPEVLPRVFELFTQGAATTEDQAQGGLGIGLSLVKRLVELHGGSVEAHSEGLGKGACFAVRLPRTGLPAGGR